MQVSVNLDSSLMSKTRLKAFPPLTLYIHIPWCVKKCPYCDFNSHEIPRQPVTTTELRYASAPKSLRPRSRPDASHAESRGHFNSHEIHNEPVVKNAVLGKATLKSLWPRSRTGASHAESRGHFNSHEIRAELPERQYVEALVTDLESALPQIRGRKIHSVFFGGGTPSLLSAESIDAILVALHARLSVDAHAEITLEANPGTFEAAKFAAFHAAGINRLSIGVQSFNSRHLKALGRIHDDIDARRAIEIAQTHFDNINLDLMYALPGQSVEEARRDIESAMAFAPQHISAYHLTIEPNTLFHRHPPQLPDDEQSAEMQEAIEEKLAARGYRHYETSAFAQQGRQSTHNLNYWLFGDYLGIGAGAHSKISSAQKIIRQMRYKQPKEYLEQGIKGKAVQQENEVEVHDLGFEFMMNALRLIDGFPVNLFEERTGLPITLLQKQLDAAEQRGLIDRNHQRIAPTRRGQRFLNDLLQLFLP